ncbi:MAG: Holliday junction branch migration protein RuvA [Desulfobacterales bacterium]|nr:MAG: Holliday junction branch migration protein RuvA [Desulfobacterales bacterium]
MPEQGEDVFFHIHTNVREDSFVLFGFLEAEEKELFLVLKTVSGIGPKLALGMLAGLRVSQLCQAIAGGDIKLLTTLPGVGKKTAERICVELKDKVASLGGTSRVAGEAVPAISTVNSNISDALSALTNLGYSEPLAREVLGTVKHQMGEQEFNALPVEALIREALRTLA